MSVVCTLQTPPSTHTSHSVPPPASGLGSHLPPLLLALRSLRLMEINKSGSPLQLLFSSPLCNPACDTGNLHDDERRGARLPLQVRPGRRSAHSPFPAWTEGMRMLLVVPPLCGTFPSILCPFHRRRRLHHMQAGAFLKCSINTNRNAHVRKM